jgi:hypothetical protein
VPRKIYLIYTCIKLPYVVLIICEHGCWSDLLFRVQYLLRLFRTLAPNKQVSARLNKKIQMLECGSGNVMNPLNFTFEAVIAMAFKISRVGR